MKELKIEFHSLIDVITNSSTELYIVMNNKAVDSMFEIIDEMLKIADSDKKAKDLFDVTLERDWVRIGERFYYEHEDDKEQILTIEEQILADKLSASKNWKFKEKIIKDEVIPYLKESGRWKDFNINYEDTPLPTWLKITAKDNNKSTIDIWKKIESLFEIVEGEQ